MNYINGIETDLNTITLYHDLTVRQNLGLALTEEEKRFLAFFGGKLWQ